MKNLSPVSNRLSFSGFLAAFLALWGGLYTANWFDPIEKTPQAGNKELTDDQPYHIDPGNYHQLGLAYSHRGYLSKAIHYFEQGAEGNNSDCCLNLANIYLNGLGMPKDGGKALDYLEKAVSLGNLEASEYLEQILDEKIGTESDFEKARSLLHKVTAVLKPGATSGVGG